MLKKRQKAPETEEYIFKKASVIIPVYNGEKFLRHCVGEVFSQTYRNIELIAIDDGSSDGSAALLQKLAQESPAHVDLRVFSQENAGICTTRNRGLDLASGQYIFFMDQDDHIRKDYIATMVSALERERADMVIGGYALIDEKGRVLERWKLRSGLPWNKYRITAPWGRVFRGEVIRDNNVRFTQTKISEDFYFNLVCMSYCRKISVTPYIGYAWTYRAASESHQGMRRQEEDRNPLPMLTQLLQDIKQPNILEKELLEYMIIKHLIWYLLYTAKGTPAEILAKTHAACFAWLREHFPDYEKNRALRAGGPRGESVKVRTIVRVSVLMQKADVFLPLLQIFAHSPK